MKRIERVAIVGMGALGSCCAGQLQRGAQDLTLYGVVRNPKEYQHTPILLNGVPLLVEYRSCRELADDSPMDLILIAVKSYHLRRAIQDIPPLVGEGTILISLLNGMSSEDALIRAFGREKVVYGVVVGADTNRSGHQVNGQSCGTLLYGDPDGLSEDTAARLEELFTRCGYPARQVPDILYHIWAKLMVNAGYNQTSTVYQQTYGQFRANGPAMSQMRAAQREVIALANRQGIPLSEDDIRQWEACLTDLSENGRSSMLQDYWMGRPMETDIFGDYICRLGRELGIPTPVNAQLNQQLKQMTVVRKGTSLRLDREKGITPRKIANQIRIDILKQKYRAGDKLVEKQLAEQYDASRSSVRTALQFLSSEGLVITHPNGRREVVEFSKRQVENLYDFRWMIENRALETILQRTNSVFPLLAESLSHIEHCCIVHQEVVDWYELDMCFHRSLVACSENIFLSNAWNSNAEIFYALMNFNTLTGYSEQYIREFFDKHRHIYELLISRDPDCIPQLRKHILDAESISRSVLDCFGTTGST